MTTFTFPQPVVDAYKNGQLGVLFGSGLSLASDVVGNFPRWNDLPERLLDLAEKQALWTPEQVKNQRQFLQAGYVSLDDMLRALDLIKNALGGPREYGAALAELFRPKRAAPGDVHRALAELGVNAVLTTNYDRLYEAADPGRIAYTWQKADIALAEIQDGRPALFKIHGSAEDSTTVVMTHSEYDRAAANVPYRESMKFLLAGNTFLLVGYGINDPLDLDLVFGLNVNAFGTANRRHYALLHKSVSPTDRTRWARDLNIQVIPYEDHADLPGILRALAQTRQNPH